MLSSQSSSMMQMVIDADTPTLPEEIIRDILKRLPVKSLIRFQCVCRHWKTLIKTPAFIADHLHQTTHQNPSLLFTRNPLGLFLLDCQMQVRQLPRAPLIDYENRAIVAGSCNGLICLDYREKFTPSFLLWNPAIREFRKLPRAIDDYEGTIYVGFGFSLIVNDYKVAMICFPRNNLEVIRGEVYSLTSGTWRGFECGMLKGLSLRCESVTANGAMFWIGSNVSRDKAEHMIVSFDIAKEVITLIPIPDANSFPYFDLTVYEDKLAILYEGLIEISVSRFLELWVWEEDAGSCGEKRSWTKKYTSKPYSWLIYSFAICKNEIVGQVTGKIDDPTEDDIAAIALFNITTGEFKLVFHGHNIIGFNYVESLVPVGGKKLFAIYM